MALFHLLRCQRYVWRGLCERAKVSRMIYGVAPLPADSPTAVVPLQAVRNAAALIAAKSNAATTDGAERKPPSGTCVRGIVWPWYRRLPRDPAFAPFIAEPLILPVYCGLRMIDEIGHVNNAKYLEISEFARRHMPAFLGFDDRIISRRIGLIVSDMSVTYRREIAPFKKVWVRLRMLLPPAAPAVTRAAEEATATQRPSVADTKRFFVEHELWSADRRTLHAVLTVAAALLGPAKYEKELHERYGTWEVAHTATGANSKPRQKMRVLNCEQVLADLGCFASTAELRQAFSSAAHARATTANANGAASSADIARAQKNSSADEELVHRLCALTEVWKRCRSALQRRTLASKPDRNE
ncbi:hypothetical protein ABB37_09445 [Leptomonas pyrrhocoris]|uniref:Thioesterase-like protein n=1 Tax=Leptomonas pyrrhocoris TaxID=157538 RepID=A0A0M9FQX2_LEPPY|nr:hypothetical protein ABB37_09445 [Leptomonas pyrrhocoris]KPA74187.1 hypothetical protein ABB37_09445 [Leptomonas pyrrhocoris]|eukprot:XP_015652626.1 hypothetical protein ABB37_09445 [Leptomonas pyrrhocoris]